MLGTKLAHFVEKKIHGLSRVTGIIAIGFLVMMMLFTVLDVFFRTVFNWPLPGIVDIIENAMVLVGFLGLGWCATRGMHIKVDLVVSLLPQRTQKIIDSFGYVIGLCICSLLSWRALEEGIAVRKMNILSSTLEMPVFPFYWVVALGYAVLCLVILVLLARSFTEAIKK